jgi:hypothetical protein
MSQFNRRRFLQGSAALGSLLASGARQVARAAPEHVDAPIVDRVVIREITDNQHNIFLKPLERPGLSVARTGFPRRRKARRLKANGASRSISNRRRAAKPGVICWITASPQMSISTTSI